MMAQATLYDAYGRPAVVTLAAPVRASIEKEVAGECNENEVTGEKIGFAYKADFVQAPGNVMYNYAHFDLDKEQAPVGVDPAKEGTLGWYYSTNNGNSSNSRLNEPLVAATMYPYSRSLFHEDGSGEVKGVAGPGDAFRAGSGHVATIDKAPVTATDSYLSKYLLMREREMKLANPLSVEGLFFKTVTLDATGNKAIIYSDKSGQNIMSLYFGQGSTAITSSYNFYDLAGRLLCSVSPNGINQYNNHISFDEIDKTSYSYNYKGWLTAMEEKDAGRTEYIYRKDGKIRFSQNAEQRKDKTSDKAERYSYTNYDYAGRPVESGEYVVPQGGISFGSDAMKAILQSQALNGGLPDSDNSKRDRVFTYYDEADAQLKALLANREQRFVAGAVSYSRKDNAITSWYSYDERGRVEWMVQQIKDFGIKTLDYYYGPTGAVEQVVYQKGIGGEQFTHFYEYDADGRLYKAYTTTQALTYTKQGELQDRSSLELQATYYYYLHGPLKRVELADKRTIDGKEYEKLQGIDYVYTADGKLKSINHADLAKDPGGDGPGNNIRKDVFGVTLDYYRNDYTSHQDANESFSLSGYEDQFGGQIKAMRWHSPIEGNKTMGYAYSYDERYQFTKADWGEAVGNTLALSAVNAYKEGVKNYDLNGNIDVLNRHDNAGKSIANYKYNYLPHSNQLEKITHEGTGNELMGYSYNQLGQLTEEKEGCKSKYLTYDVSGKVTGVYAHYRDGIYSLPIATFSYDERGFRLSKKGYDDSGKAILTTWYVRDASGNVVSTYEDKVTDSEGPKATEIPLYASGKIGIYKPAYAITFYELTDHLGNVRAVIGEGPQVSYLATMESERARQKVLETGEIINEGEEDEFLNMRRATADLANHTPGKFTLEDTKEIVNDPDEVLRINNKMDSPKQPIGAAKMLPVYPGDKLQAEVYVKYANFEKSENTALTGMATYLASAFGGLAFSKDGVNIFSHLDGQSPTGVFSALGNVDENQPKAFLSYILLDKNFVPVKFDQVQVSEAAQILSAGSVHEKLTFKDDITIDKEGFIYIYISNQSEGNIDVYFDDLKITHQYSDIVAGGDYYPFGMEIQDRQITREDYRYGYQGQYAEKDQETGWNSFELGIQYKITNLI